MTTWSRAQANFKGVKSVFSTFLVMSAVQNKTYKLTKCQARGANPIGDTCIELYVWKIVQDVPPSRNFKGAI